MNRISSGLVSLCIVGICLAMLPFIVDLGLLILATDPNPRHPPEDLMGEAMGWAIIGTLSGALCAVLADSFSLPEDGSFMNRNKPLILGSLIGIVIAAFLGMNFAVLQMDSVDGQAITSVNLAIMAGALVATLGSISGVISGITVRRTIVGLMS